MKSVAPSSSSPRLVWNVIWKALLLFLIFNLLFAAFPIELSWVSAYNTLLPGRKRFPFGENPQQAYNLSLYDLEAMFASHELAAPKAEDEFRVILLGDSSTWGTLLRPEQTLAGRLEEMLNPSDCAGREVRVYNLGYPTLSLTKDLMILDRALDFDPDLVVWLVTLESFPQDVQTTSPIVANNAGRVRRLVERYDLSLDVPCDCPSLWDQTIVGQRRALADWFRLQFYGVMWAATRIDQFYPPTYNPAARDLEPDETFHGWQPPDLPANGLALDVLAAGVRAVQTEGLPVILVNEPILVSRGENSEIRYNFYYPRWAYDQYRQILDGISRGLGWAYLDLWDLVPEAEFTNSAIHRTPAGEQAVADALFPEIRSLVCREVDGTNAEE